MTGIERHWKEVEEAHKAKLKAQVAILAVRIGELQRQYDSLMMELNPATYFSSLQAQGQASGLSQASYGVDSGFSGLIGALIGTVGGFHEN